ncbi:uncharacterized protein LOC117001554 [Catharus ustulatus]|uniref:uncharacterized protein LOC117001554 n=1 Tax=Catharus ustulatus TaxID=91951 RepID=UPI00140D8BB7|nr:uncharacterized protein LOC117001554 [Catharus ustulatus]
MVIRAAQHGAESQSIVTPARPWCLTASRRNPIIQGMAMASPAPHITCSTRSITSSITVSASRLIYRCLWVSILGSGWKFSLKSSSPNVSPALNQVPKCHIHTLVNPCRDGSVGCPSNMAGVPVAAGARDSRGPLPVCPHGVSPVCLCGVPGVSPVCPRGVSLVCPQCVPDLFNNKSELLGMVLKYRPNKPSHQCACVRQRVLACSLISFLSPWAKLRQRWQEADKDSRSKDCLFPQWSQSTKRKKPRFDTASLISAAYHSLFCTGLKVFEISSHAGLLISACISEKWSFALLNRGSSEATKVNLLSRILRSLLAQTMAVDHPIAAPTSICWHTGSLRLHVEKMLITRNGTEGFDPLTWLTQL